MRIATLLALTIFASGCATMSNEPVLPKESQRVEFKIETALSKNEAFERAKKWVATNYSSSKSSLPYENKREGVFVQKFIGSCGFINSSGERIIQEKIAFTMEFKAANNSATATFKDFGHGDLGREVETASKLAEIERRCLSIPKQELSAALSKSAD